MLDDKPHHRTDSAGGAVGKDAVAHFRTGQVAAKKRRRDRQAGAAGGGDGGGEMEWRHRNAVAIGDGGDFRLPP